MELFVENIKDRELEFYGFESLEGLPEGEFDTSFFATVTLSYENNLFLFEYDDYLWIFWYDNDSKKISEYSMSHKDIELIKDRDFSEYEYNGEVTVNCKDFNDIEFLNKIPMKDIAQLEWSIFVENFNKLPNGKIKEKFLSTLSEKSQKYFEEYKKDYYTMKSGLSFLNSNVGDCCLFLTEGLYDFSTNKIYKNGLFSSRSYIYCKDCVVIKKSDENKEQKIDWTEDLDLDISVDKIIYYVHIKTLTYPTILFKQLDEEYFLGYNNEVEEIITLYKKIDDEFKKVSYEKLQIVETDEVIEVKEQKYKDEYKTLFKKKLNSSGDMITIGDKTFEYDSKIKDKIIGQWNSIIWDFVLLEDGKLWGYTSESFGEFITNEVLLEKNCENIDFIIGWNSSVTIVKTNNYIHYFPRLGNINDDEVIKYHYKEELTDDIKDNSLVKIPYTSKYSKANKLWSIQLLPPLQVVLDDNDEAILENNSEEYALYDYKKGFVHMTVGERDMLIVLNQENINTKNYEGPIIFNTEKTKRWTGMNKWTIKDNGNYFVVRNKNKKRVFVYVEWDDNTDKYGINGDKYFIEQGDYYLGNGEFCGKDTKFFDDKNLPNKMYVERDSIRSIIFPEDWDDEKGGSYTEITTPEDKYSQSSIARKKK